MQRWDKMGSSVLVLGDGWTNSMGRRRASPNASFQAPLLGGRVHAILIETPTADSVRDMTNAQIESVRSPFDDPRIASRAVATLIRADAMGAAASQGHLSRRLGQARFWSLGRAGICRSFLGELRHPTGMDPAHFGTVLEAFALQVVIELLFNERGQRSAFSFESGEKLLVVSLDDSMEWCLFRTVALVDIPVRASGWWQSSQLASAWSSWGCERPDGVSARPTSSIAIWPGELGAKRARRSRHPESARH